MGPPLPVGFAWWNPVALIIFPTQSSVPKCIWTESVIPDLWRGGVVCRPFPFTVVITAHRGWLRSMGSVSTADESVGLSNDAWASRVLLSYRTLFLFSFPVSQRAFSPRVSSSHDRQRSISSIHCWIWVEEQSAQLLEICYEGCSWGNRSTIQLVENC